MRSQKLKDRLKSRYDELNREIKRMAQTKRKYFLSSLQRRSEEAARKQDLKTLHRIQKSEVPVQHTNGNIV